MKKNTEKKEDYSRSMAITIKAVVLKDDKVLLLKRSKKSLNAGKWDLPGGHIKKGETIEESIKREIKEETTLEVEIGQIIGTTEFPKDDKLFKDEKRGLRYICYYENGEVELNEREHSEFKWLVIEEAIEMLDDDGFEGEKRDVLIAAKKYLEMKNAEERAARILADFENYKKRSAEQNAEFKKYCLEGFVLELLPVIDNFEMSVAHVPEGQGGDPWVAGILHIKNQFLKLLEEKGVREIPAKPGDKLNENIHEVVSGKGKKIKKVLKKGFKIEEKVIRPVSVEL